MAITISTYTKFDELRSLLESPASGAAFILPTSRDEDWLIDLLGVENDGIFEDVKIYSWSDLYRMFAEKNISCTRLRQIDPPDHRLILRYLTEKFKDENPDIVKNLPGISRSGFVDLLSDTLHELLSEEISPCSLEPLGGTEVLLPLYQHYVSYLEKNRLMDSTQIATKTREIISDKISREKFIFAGFLSFTHAQKNLIENMGFHGADISIFKPESNVKGLRDASAQFVKHRLGHTSEKEGGNYFLLDSADTLSEPENVARELALWSRGEGVFARHEFHGWGAIGILIPQAKYSEFENSLSRYRVSFSGFAGKRVSETPLGVLPGRVYSAYIDGWREEETAILLAHPCLGGGALEAMKIFCEKIDRGGTPTAILEILLNFLSTKGLWLDALEKMVESDESGVWDGELREISSAILELERKIIFMKELQPKIGHAGDIKLTGRAAIEYLKNWSEEAQTATQPPIENSVSIFDSLPTLANFEIFMIAGVCARTFPGNIISSPLLDEENKIKLNDSFSSENEMLSHLPTLHEQKTQKDALLKRLLYAGRKFTIISRPLSDEKGRPLTASPSLAAILNSPQWLQIGCAKVENTIPHDRPYFDEIEILEDEKTNFRISPTSKEEPILEVNISKIDELLECPFLYWARQIKKISEPTRGIYDHVAAGTLAHKIWEIAWKIKKENDEPLVKIISEIWDDARQFYECLFTDKRLARRRELLRAQIMESAALQDEIEKNLRGARTGIEIEKKVSFEHDGVLFKGRCDRVDILGSDRVILDYKSGRFDKKFQLGTYSAALQNEGLNVCGAGHIILKKNEVSGTFDPPYNISYVGRNTRNRVEALIAETKFALSRAAETVKKGEYKPNYDSELCSKCSFIPLCRRAEMRGETVVMPEDV